MVGFLWAWLGSMKLSLEEAGYSKYYAYIPFLNVLMFMKASKVPTWWFLLMFIPFFSLVVFSFVVLARLDNLGITSKKERLLIVLFYPITSRGVL